MKKLSVIMLATIMQLNGAAGRAATIDALKAGRSYLTQSGRFLSSNQKLSILPMTTAPTVSASLLRPTAMPLSLFGDNKKYCRTFSSSGKPCGLGYTAFMAGIIGTMAAWSGDWNLAYCGAFGYAAGFGNSLGKWEKAYLIKGFIKHDIDQRLKFYSDELENNIGIYKDQLVAAKAELEKESNASTKSLYTQALQIAQLAKRRRLALDMFEYATRNDLDAKIPQDIVIDINYELELAQKLYEASLRAYKAEKSGSRVIQE